MQDDNTRMLKVKRRTFREIAEMGGRCLFGLMIEYFDNQGIRLQISSQSMEFFHHIF
jgi:hypothetical protein